MRDIDCLKSLINEQINNVYGLRVLEGSDLQARVDYFSSRTEEFLNMTDKEYSIWLNEEFIPNYKEDREILEENIEDYEYLFSVMHRVLKSAYSNTYGNLNIVIQQISDSLDENREELRTLKKEYGIALTSRKAMAAYYQERYVDALQEFEQYTYRKKQAKEMRDTIKHWIEIAVRDIKNSNE